MRLLVVVPFAVALVLGWLLLRRLLLDERAAQWSLTMNPAVKRHMAQLSEAEQEEILLRQKRLLRVLSQWFLPAFLLVSSGYLLYPFILR